MPLNRNGGMMSSLKAFTTVAYAAVTSLVLVGVGSRTANAQAKLDDPTIVAIFDAANTWDIETGNLAAKQAKAKDVKDFGAMLAHDHTEIRKQGRDLAAKLKVTPT